MHTIRCMHCENSGKKSQLIFCTVRKYLAGICIQVVIMNTRSVLIVSVVFLGVLLTVSPGDACFKKIRTLLRGKGKEEQPAELIRDEYLKYSHGSNDVFYIEITNENKDALVREMEREKPPIAMSQLGELEEKPKGSGELEPDAEYIDKNETVVANKTGVSEVQPGAENPEEEEEEVEILSPEDQGIRDEWGGKCMHSDWTRCNKIPMIHIPDVINTPFERKNFTLNCTTEPVLCLTNGWTANRCHILCMASQCNKSLFFTWDAIVDFEGPCRYRK